MIHSVTLTGQSHGKGRNGYFALSHTTLMEVASDQEQSFHLDFCSKRSGAAALASYSRGKMPKPFADF